MDFSLADLARITGAKRRTVQHWAATGVILANPETERGGTGVHRRFSRDEVVIACLVHAFSFEHQMSVGALLRLSEALRESIHGSAIFNQWVAEAIRNEAALYVMLIRDKVGKDSSASFTVQTTQKPLIPNVKVFEDIGRRVVEDLNTDGGLITIIIANPYLRGLS